MMVEISEEESCSPVFIKITVLSRIEPYASYVNYEIRIETNDPSFTFEHSSTRRRYSDFRTLHSIFTKQFPFVKVPKMPPRAIFKKTFDLDFIEKRRAALEAFLAELLSKKIYLSSKAFHLFLQSSYTMEEIKNIVEGKVPDLGNNTQEILQKNFILLSDGSNSSVSSHDSALDSDTAAAGAVASSSNTSHENSAMGVKKVSFCDLVTVAEVHLSLPTSISPSTNRGHRVRNDINAYDQHRK